MMTSTRSSWLIYLALLLPISAVADTRAEPPHLIQIFALSGPVCPVTVISIDGDISAPGCADMLLANVELMLERFDKQEHEYVPVTTFETNEKGYAKLQVHKRGIYRVNVFAEPSPSTTPNDYPLFLGPVMFKVPARHFGPQDLQLTPVVVKFDSGIR